MGRTGARAFRPTIDRLEVRQVMSTIATAPATVTPPAHVAPGSPPVLTRTTFDRVMHQIDRAFAAYRGHADAPSVLSGLAQALVSAVSPPQQNPVNNPNISTDQADTPSFIEDGQGDGVYLEDGLRKAVDQLPYGDARAAPLIVKAWGAGGLSPNNANFYRDHFKAMVHHYVDAGIASGDFVMVPAAHHPTSHRAPAVGPIRG